MDACNRKINGKACAQSHPCRGRVFFAFQAGIPVVELIKILGDWYSGAVLLYLTVPITIRLKSVTLFAKAVSSHHTTSTPHFGFGV